MFTEASDEFEIDAINKTDVPVVADVVVTPSVQYLIIACCTAQRNMA
jgi:hypothetical protein